MQVPNDSILEREILPYRDETGYLSIDQRNKYLQSKRLIRLVGKELVGLVDSKTGEMHFLKWRDRIDIITNRKNYKKIGDMGVSQVHSVTNNVNDIKAEEVDF